MKDAYYFSHDSNAKDDPKCVLLIEQLGLEGYGIYWVLVEILREQPSYKYPLNLLPALARRFNSTHEKFKAVVFSYDLFTVENEMLFFSNSLIERMNVLEEKRLKRSIAGKAGNAVKYGNKQNELAMRSQCDPNDDAMRSECLASKVNKSKENNNKEKDNIKPVWKTDFSIYQQDLRKAFEDIKNDTEFISTQEQYYHNVDILLSIHKACVNFWNTEEGWKNKKLKSIKKIDWKATFAKSIDKNKVYKHGIIQQSTSEAPVRKPYH